MELRKLITYRADFWVNFFGQTIFSLTIAYFLWKSIFHYSGSETLQGYTLESMIFYYLVAPLIFRIQQGSGIGFASRDIYQGTLNKYLIYPVDFYSFKFSTYIAHSVFYVLQLFFILILYNSFFYDPKIFQFSFSGIIMFMIAMSLACTMFYFLFTLTEFLAFWFDNVWSLGVILRFGTSFLGGAVIPLKFFPEILQQFLAFTPFPYLIDFPVFSLRNEILWPDFLSRCGISIAWTLAFALVSKFIWNKGQYKYTGVGI